jgi:hypothetical protein
MIFYRDIQMKSNLVLSMMLVFSCSHAFAAGKLVGQLGLVDGEVFLDAKPVQKNAKVFEGSVIEVKQGHATLLLGKGSVFNLGADSKIVVDQYLAKSDTQIEGADIDLKFGRTRALILNEGKEKKDIKIKVRAATMGVRGTEIFIDAPKEASKPIQFFTLEGRAEVTAHPGAPVVPVAQNQGVATSGAPAPAANSGNGANSKSGSGSSGGGASTGTVSTAQAGAAGSGTSAATMSMSDVKAELKKSGLDVVVAAIPASAVTTAANSPGSLSGTIGIGSLPPIQFDPIQDKATSTLSILPKFCNGTNPGLCN